MNIPVSVGVPAIVIELDNQVAITPVGKPVGVPIPVAPVVVCVTVGKTVWIHIEGDKLAAVTVLSGVTVMVTKLVRFWVQSVTFEVSTIFTLVRLNTVVCKIGEES